jgi:hypothetical protein
MTKEARIVLDDTARRNLVSDPAPPHCQAIRDLHADTDGKHLPFVIHDTL